MSSVSTHVLDTAGGHPAVGVLVKLESGFDGVDRRAVRTLPSMTAVTDEDGRVTDFGPLTPGVYRLIFDGASLHGADAFFPEVIVTFRISEPDEHYHVPLLVSPFGYSTYRGS